MSGEELKAAHPNTDQGVTAEDREAASKVAVTAEWKDACLAGKLDRTLPVQTMRHHRLATKAALEAQIASLKQRLESAEEVIREVCLSAECAAGCDEQVTPDTALSEIMKAMGTAMAFSYGAARAFLQEQEKQNG